MTTKVNLNTVLNAYNRFAETNDDKTAGRLRFNGKDCKISVVPLAKGSGLERELQGQTASDRARMVFFNGIVAQFGGAKKIPEKVLKAMYEKGFGDVNSCDGEQELMSKFMTGKPLEARHIKKVVKAVSTATCDSPDLLVDNLVKVAVKRLDERPVDGTALRDSLVKLFEGALPPKWSSATHLKEKVLTGYFRVRRIGDLGDRVKELIDQICQDDGGDAGQAEPQGEAHGGKTRGKKQQVEEMLSKLKELFSDSKVQKQDHVGRFLSAYSSVANGGVARDAAALTSRRHDQDELNDDGSRKEYQYADKGDYSYERRGRTNAELLAGRTGFDPANPDLALDVDNTTPENFFKILLHATACAEEGKAFAGNGGERPEARMLGWVRAKMGELIQSAVKDQDEETRNSTRKLFDACQFFAYNEKIPLMRQVVLAVFAANTATSLLPSKVNGGDDISPQRQWFRTLNALINKYEKSEYNLDCILFESGYISSVTGQEVDTVREVARYVLGSKAGREGGEGYVGLMGGKAFKFLTNVGERMRSAGRGLTQQDKGEVSAATRQLRRALMEIAKKIDPSVASVVNRLLAMKSVDGMDVLERKDVAKAITCLAPHLVGQDGGRFDWAAVERQGAVRLEDTYLKSALAEVRGRTAEQPAEAAGGGENQAVREEPQGAPAGGGENQTVWEEPKPQPKPQPQPKPLASPLIVSGKRVEQYVKDEFSRDTEAAARLVNSSATNLNCLFYSLQKCVGQREDDAGAEAMRKTLDFLAKQDLQAYCTENGFDYRQVVDNATENGNLPAGFAHEKMALAQYLHEVEHSEGNVFADAVLLKYAANVYRRPIVLVTPQRRGEETFLASETFNPNNPGPGDEKPIYLYLQANHYQTILVGEQAADVNGSAPAGEEPIDTRSKPSQAQPAAKQPAADPFVGKSLPRAITGKEISAEEERAALEYMKGKDEELARLLKGVTSSLKRTGVLTRFMKDCFDDKAFRRNSAIAARALGLGIVTKADLKTGKVNKKGLPALGKLGRQNFVIEYGATDVIAAKYKQAHPEAKVCALDYADNTLTFGGIFKGWLSQEETLFRQVGLATFGPLFDHELTEPRGTDEYVYQMNAETQRPKVVPAEGYLIKGRQDRVDGITLEKSLDMHYLVSCAPSFPKDKSSFDPHNNAQCAIATFKEKKGVEPTGKQYVNGVAMLKRVWELKFSIATRNKMQKILIFTNKIDLFNLKPEKQDAVLGELAKDIEAGLYDKLLAKINADDSAYDRALQARFDGWVKMCSAAEIDYLIAGPIGCGAFGNDARKIARAFARAWVKYGKGDFIYAQYSEDAKSDATAKIFREAFEEAQRLRVKLLEEDGYEMAEIVAALHEGGYSQAEIEQLFRNAGHAEKEIEGIKKLLSSDTAGSIGGLKG